MATNPGSPGNTPNPDTLENIKDLLTDILKLQTQSADSNKVTSGELQKHSDHAKKQLDLVIKRGAKEKEIAEATIKSKKAELDLINKIAEERGKYEDDEVKRIKEINEELEKEEKVLEKINKKHKESEGTLEKIREKTSQLISPFTTILGTATGLTKELQSASSALSSFTKGNIGEGILKVLTAGIDFYVSRVFSVAELIENTRAKSVSATGQIQKTATMFGASLMEYGIGIEKLTDSSIDLFNNMAAFSEQNVGIQKRLVENSAKMANLGVSTTITGKNFNDLTKSLKFSTNEVTNINDKMAKAAISAGIAPKKMLEEFSSALPKIAAYGQHGIDVYIGLQKAAKSLGMEMSTLNSIVGDQFDTFEGSAKAAGQLNAVLGGNYLNSVEMLNATEEQRIVMMKQALDASGKSWDSMGKFERKALAATLNITDLNVANELFGSSTKKLTEDMKKQDATQEQLSKAQQDAATRAQKNAIVQEALMKSGQDLNNMLNELAKTIREKLVAVLLKIDEVVRDFMGNIQRHIETLKKWYEEHEKGVKIVGGIIVAMLALIALVKLFSSGSSLVVSATTGLLQFGAAILMIGAGIGLAAWGLSTLVSAFKDLNAEQQKGALFALGIVLVGFIAIIALLGKTAIVVSPGLLELSLVMLALSVPIFALGKLLQWAGPVMIEIFKEIAASVRYLINVIQTIALTVLNVFMYTLDKAVQGMKVMFDGIGMLMDKANPTNVASLFALAGAIVALTAAFAGAAVGGVISGALNWITGKAGEGTLVEKIEKLSIALRDLSQDKVVGLSNAMNSLMMLSQQKVASDSILGSLGVLNTSLNTLPAQLSAVASSLESLRAPVSVFGTFAENLKKVRTELNAFSEQYASSEFNVVAKQYKEDQSSFSGMFSNAIDKLTSMVSGDKNKESETKITLVVDTRELVEAFKGNNDGRIHALLTR